MAIPRPRGHALADLIPPAVASNPLLPPPPLRCCCGHDECVFLSHNQSVLDSVERDVHTAAKLGQALLARHEAYMADAERDHQDLTARIEQLEMDKRELQAENTRTAEENRVLLDQLEALNTTIHHADVRIQTLEATLLSSQQAVRRLEGAAARAEALERHVALLEREQAQLQNNLIATESEARSTMQRWKRAERGITELQGQLERMEKEARDERERHVEAMSRMERQRQREVELNTAAGRLKGAAAAKALDKGNNGGSVVSHFLRDLLQDNANLQLGMAELREMLNNSNDEIQALRYQLMHHQPVAEEDIMSSTVSTLRAELQPSQQHDNYYDGMPTTRLSQEFHIHHHYHVSQKAEPRRPRRRRGHVTSSAFSLPGSSAPSVVSHSHRDSASTFPRPPSNRWSLFSDPPSDMTASSVPSSPPSAHGYSVFDRVPDTDVPSSPTTSIDPMSPTFVRTGHVKRPSEASNRSVSLPSHLIPAPQLPSLHSCLQPATPEPIAEENHEDETDPDIAQIPTPPANESQSEEQALPLPDLDDSSTPRLRRVYSHESIMSLTGGLDIHTLRSRPSQLTLRPLGGAEVVFTGVTASSTISRVTTKRSASVLRDSLAALPAASTPARSLSPSSATDDSSGKLGRWVSWRPWRGGGSPSNTDGTVSSTKKPDKESGVLQRVPGINQPGAIPGLQEYLASHQYPVPSKVLPDMVDIDALRESLEESKG
ncbi:hypothetical protein SODALDRAFT_335646 [Sodiomyces alkalinus F11]|uniref:Uncharacterized protein n=1 Tax=Sodiomyces alkalinus (strain CBS 110278 / VKM F-3762 / F11) TaxID=1314773 RepID=A0A3N2PQ11_SODAK|nr:hypothetical protein SODALDRAFT_335646 [Sodiomyces alkalinus F11]ROT36544.1 hypothetical protein SODALDRAFT_335646 [Sodiomyces alkalinus F11]